MNQQLTVDRFLDLFGTRNGRWLANRLNLSGKGSQQLADLLSAYAWNQRAADTLHGVQTMKGHSTAKNSYRTYCEQLKDDITAHPLFERVNRRLAFW